MCLSASAVAYSSTRIENMFMSVGSAAGVAAKQLVDGEAKRVQDVDVARHDSMPALAAGACLLPRRPSDCRLCPSARG